MTKLNDRWFIHPVRDPKGRVHAARHMFTGTECGVPINERTMDPKTTDVPTSLEHLLARTTCQHCIREILLVEAAQREES